MKRQNLFATMGALCLGLSLASSAHATVIDLYDYGLNIDGSVILPFMGDPIPAEVDVSGFDDLLGLGEISITLTGSGSHSVLAFFDHEIDESTNTFFNESGVSSGSAAAGQSWEIDEPGYVFGDIYDNFLDNTLDNTSSLTSGFEDDVSMAMGWDFILSGGQTATITFGLGTVAPEMGFFLMQSDPDSLFADSTSDSIYFYSDLTVVPEPGTLLLFLSGVLLMFSLRRERLSTAR